MRHLALALALTLPASAAGFAESIGRVLASSPTARAAFWGIQVLDLKTGRTLYELNAQHFFVPASNTKLFTTALALTRLGPAHTFETRVLAEAPPDAAGVLHGPLRLIGGGDPNLSPRTIPYKVGPVTGDPLSAIEDLAAQVAAHGVRRIEGDIIGDDSWYVWQPYADGWSIDDPLYDYGAPVSALTINDNTLTVAIRSGEHEGDPASITLSPPLEYYTIDNRIRTGAASAERHIDFNRAAGSFELELWGTVPLRGTGQELLLGIEEPARYAVLALRQELEKRGIVVTGETAAQHQFPNTVSDLKGSANPSPAPEGVELARRTSAPLLEDLRITDKVSQNLHAEMALRAVGRARRNVGSREAGLAEMKTFLGEAGVADDAFTFHDGSGLSRLNLVTPSAVVRLLRYMYSGKLRENWISLLPVGGQDGTLQGRFGGAAAGRIHAKTGSLAHVNALSGYAVRGNGEWVAFSILVNNSNSESGEVRAVMDRICNLILE
jgi:D-alanyl-D-alanine carboxypeptidase/D-alanyl-D-alanine-endopeptidase (penicillin-binding protein 4)